MQCWPRRLSLIPLNLHCQSVGRHSDSSSSSGLAGMSPVPSTQTNTKPYHHTTMPPYHHTSNAMYGTPYHGHQATMPGVPCIALHQPCVLDGLQWPNMTHPGYSDLGRAIRETYPCFSWKTLQMVSTTSQIYPPAILAHFKAL